jgi:hypothetical protein
MGSAAPVNRGTSLRKTGFALAAVAALSTVPAWAQDGAFARVLQCKNENARVELYLPDAIAHGGNDWRALEKTTAGYFALDLSDAGKGKPLEPVRVTLTKDKRGLIVDQYTRGLPPTTVPLEGGKVSFDKRFAENMTCGPVEAN